MNIIMSSTAHAQNFKFKNKNKNSEIHREKKRNWRLVFSPVPSNNGIPEPSPT